MWQKLREAAKELISAIAQLLWWIFYLFFQLPYIRKAIAGLWSMWFMWGFHAFVKLCPEEAAMIARRVADAYYTPPVEWQEFLALYLNRLTGAEIDPKKFLEMPPGWSQRQYMWAIGDTFLKPMLDLVLPTKEEIEEKPFYGIEGFLAANLQFQMSSWLLHLLGDMISFGIFKSLKDLPNAIAWSFGIGWLSWMAMGPIFRYGITEPAEKKLRRMYRPETLTMRQLFDAYAAGYRSGGEVIEDLRDRGYEEHDIAMLFDLMKTRVPRSTMEFLFERGFVKEEDLLQFYRLEGLDKRERLLQLMQVKERKLARIEDRILDQYLDLYQDGVVDETQVREYAALIGISDELVDLDLKYRDLRRTPTRKLSAADIGRLYREGFKDRSWALGRLNEIFITPQEAQDFLSLYEVKPPRKASVGLEVTFPPPALIQEVARRRSAVGLEAIFPAEEIFEEVRKRRSSLGLTVEFPPPHFVYEVAKRRSSVGLIFEEVG